MTHPNEVPTYRLTPADYEQMCARTTERQQRQLDAQHRAEVWPLQVDRAIAVLADRTVVQDQQLAAIDARLAKLEAAMGLTEG